MFSLHATPEKFRKATISNHFGLVFDETRSGKSRDYHDVIIFEKLRFQNVFRLHENEKLAFSNFPSLKSVFEKLRLREGLAWTVGLDQRNKPAFSDFSSL